MDEPKYTEEFISIEFAKIKDPVYFYNTYVRLPDQKLITQDDMDNLEALSILQRIKLRNPDNAMYMFNFYKKQIINARSKK